MKAIFSIFLLVCAMIFTIIAFTQFNAFTNGRPGPGFFPGVIGTTMVVLLAINTVKDFKSVKNFKELKNKEEARQIETDENSGSQHEKEKELAATVESDIPGPTYGRDAFIVAILIIGFIAVLPLFGAIVSMITFMLVALFYLNRRGYIVNIACSFVLPIGLYLLFDVWLQSNLPVGIFGI